MKDDIHIGVATIADEPALRHFLHQHWRANHPLSLNPWLLRWQHECPEARDDLLTFMVARRAGDDGLDALLAVLGFIPFRRYDPAANWSELALALWKVRPDAAAPGLGVRLHQAIMERYEPEMVCVLGTTEAVRPLYRALGYRQGVLAHSALFAMSNRSTAVARSVPAEAFAAQTPDPGIKLEDYRSALQKGTVTAACIDELGAANSPRKSARYVQMRYLEHPCYEYEVRVVRADGSVRAVLVWRRVAAPAGSVLRIVDIIGEAEVLQRCGAALRSEVERAGCEYVDAMYFGVAPEVFRAAGFVSLDDYPELVLPSHFSPFKQTNVRTGFAFKFDPARMGDRKLRLFRADSDQDRPNENALLEQRLGRR